MTMQRVRRLASLAVVASLAVLGLSACRSEPSVAAYVGSSRITETRVQQVWDDAYQRLAASAKGGAAESDKPVTMPITRAQVVATLVGAEVLKRVVEQQKITIPPSENLTTYADALGLPVESEFAQLYGRQIDVLTMLRSAVKNPPQAADADVREVFNRLVAAKQFDPTMTFETFKDKLPEQNKTVVNASAAVSHDIARTAESMHIRINPRYQPLTLPVLEFQLQSGALQTLLSAPLGDEGAAGAVTDVR